MNDTPNALDDALSLLLIGAALAVMFATGMEVSSEAHFGGAGTASSAQVAQTASTTPAQAPVTPRHPAATGEPALVADAH